MRRIVDLLNLYLQLEFNFFPSNAFHVNPHTDVKKLQFNPVEQGQIKWYLTSWNRPTLCSKTSRSLCGLCQRSFFVNAKSVRIPQNWMRVKLFLYTLDLLILLGYLYLIHRPEHSNFIDSPYIMFIQVGEDSKKRYMEEDDDVNSMVMDNINTEKFSEDEIDALIKIRKALQNK